MWKGFALGIVVTVVVAVLCTYFYVSRGYVDARADIPLGPEDHFLGRAMDASTERHAPRVKNPLQANAANLTAGEETYTMYCAMCHGSHERMHSGLADSFYPRAPQFFGGDPADMPQDQNFYIIKHGVRFTAMPAWEKVLSDQQIWELVTYLANSNMANQGSHEHAQ